MFLTNCAFSRVHLVLQVNITRPSNAIEESNRFRKRYKGAEFTIVRTKGAARAVDISSEDEGSNDLQDLAGDSEQEANSDNSGDDLVEPHEPGKSEKEADSDNLELQESGDSDSKQEENGRDELELREQGDIVLQERQEPGDSKLKASDNSDNLELQEPDDSEPRACANSGNLELQEPGNSEQEANADNQKRDNAATEEYQDENGVLKILVENAHAQAPAARTSSFLCLLTKLDHFLSIDDLVKETNPYYCRSGFYLNGRHCAKCDVGFVLSLSKNGSVEREVRPCVKTPGWVCLHEQKNASMSGTDQNKESGTCTFVLCHDCFQMQVVPSSSSAKKSTLTRRTPTGRQD